MYNFFKKHPEFVLISLAILFLAIIVGSFGWGIVNLVGSMNQAINVGAGAGEGVASFDLKGAAALDLKGAIK